MELKDNEIGFIEKDLAGFCLSLCLLLNAGMTVTSSISRLLEYCDEDALLFRLLKYVEKSAISKNISFEYELYQVARIIKSKDLMRIALLLSNSQLTGSELSGKLEQEYESLQSSRLHLARAKAKEADTKLCFPLMLLLVSILLITMSPAFMQM